MARSLLQTEHYSRALIATARDRHTTAHGDRRTADLRAELRQKRQRLLTREGAPAIRIVLNEAALAVRFGGAETMAAQLDQLVSASSLPNLTIRVLPLATEAFAAAGGTFTIFGFANSEMDSPIVYNEFRTTSHYRDNPEEVAVYRADFDDVWRKASPPGKSRDLITHWAAAHRDAARRSS